VCVSRIAHTEVLEKPHCSNVLYKESKQITNSHLHSISATDNPNVTSSHIDTNILGNI